MKLSDHRSISFTQLWSQHGKETVDELNIQFRSIWYTPKPNSGMITPSLSFSVDSRLEAIIREAIWKRNSERKSSFLSTACRWSCSSWSLIGLSMTPSTPHRPFIWSEARTIQFVARAVTDRPISLINFLEERHTAVTIHHHHIIHTVSTSVVREKGGEEWDMYIMNAVEHEGIIRISSSTDSKST